MPMSQHRPALAATLVAVVAVLSAIVGMSPAKAAPPSSTSPIAERAILDLGTWQGECWLWMKEVVLDATGKTVGFDYRQGFFEAGGVEVSLGEAGPGDIIQIAMDSWTSPDADYAGLHTAIILEANGDGTFLVIDSNRDWDGMVNLRENYDPAAMAASRGLNFHIYRLDGISTEGLAPPAPPTFVGGPLAEGDNARVNTPGECLNLRSVPFGTLVTCLAHGTQVAVTGAPRAEGGILWVPVTTPAGSGWMAAQYLLKEAAPTAEPSGTGQVKPVYQYRAFMPVTASD